MNINLQFKPLEQTGFQRINIITYYRLLIHGTVLRNMLATGLSRFITTTNLLTSAILGRNPERGSHLLNKQRNP